MTRKSTSPMIDDKCADFYKTTWGSVNAGTTYVLDAFPALYKRTLEDLKGRFSREELLLMIDVNNGLWLTPRIAGQHMDAQVSDGIALDHLDEKWEIDGDALNKKVADLSIFEAACLEIWIMAFWEQEAPGDIEAYVAELMAK